MDKNRWFSLALAVLASLFSLFSRQSAEDIAWGILGSMIATGMIWFSDEIGSYSGPSSNGPMVPTPGIIIRFFGWLFLLVIFLGAGALFLHPKDS